MIVKKPLLIAMSLVSVGVWANPAPVTEISKSGRTTSTSATAAAVGTVEQRLATLERVVEARAEGQVRMQQQLQILLDEVSDLRGVTETHSYRLDEIIQRQRDIYQEIERRVSAVQGGASNAAPSSATPATSGPAVMVSGNVSENDAYDRAVNMVLKDRRYDAAIPEFENFLRTYPNSVYAPNAHYWLGQLLFNNGELAKAKTEFERVVKNFAESSKVADALLKLGQIAERNNDKATALGHYRTLVSAHGSSTAAKLAKERLEALK
ncbi:tol-pal system protein YbgF [Alishewanella sp. 16-MA]|uniref:Cell division coordinator CpoB n=1 Tax=Alishewanella maricola TaxID=2795740 RepID=A0ABS8C1Q9_9ALTE|nr:MULTISPECIES: tol-pal system protein YbgF [Gammaproteobacteria]MCB5226249.1 tol-pal system protein YbgF [Alishewanella maricola]MCC5450363.1 tol-pal system protein YbgF [Rheinheimera sp. UJ51]MCF4009202.1 tol-pal system protein YbgF [Rheinheimera sp. UJ63]MDP5460051.1 tol-pal system protein YbgF [Alishewanella sp. SMS8]